MKHKATILVLLLTVAFFSTTVWSQLLKDDFTEDTVGVLDGQGSWVFPTGTSGTSHLTVANTTPLTYPGYSGGGGNYVVMPKGGSTNRTFKLFTPVTNYSGTTFYISFLLRLDTVYANSVNYFMSLGNAAGSTTSLAPKIFAKSNGTGFNIGLSKQTTTLAKIAYDTNTVLNLKQTYLIVMRYVFNTAGTTAPAVSDDECELWVNPSMTTEPSPSATNWKVLPGTDNDFDGYGAISGGVGSFIWHNRGSASPQGAFDGLAVANGTTSAAAWANLLNSPYLTISPTSKDFGSLNVNATATDSLTVTNAGSSSINITSVVSSNAHFVVSPTTATIPASSNLKFAVTYAPTVVANDSGSIVFVSNSMTSPDTVKVIGSGVQAGFAVAPKILDFGSVLKDSTKIDSTVTVTNASTSASLVIDSVRVESSSTYFTLSPTSITIPAGSSAKFTISFMPKAKGAFTGNIVFYHNAPSKQDTVEVSGQGALIEPLFSASPASLNFHGVLLGESKKDSITITNTGHDVLEVLTVVSTDGAFTITPTVGTIAIAASQKFYITFTPNAVGAKGASLLFYSTVAEGIDTVKVSGTGIGAVSIAEARIDANNDFIADHSVTKDTMVIYGVVTTPNMGFSASQTSYFIQDATGGIDVFFFGLTTTNYAIGDSVMAVGIVAQYRGLVEFTVLALDDANFKILKHNAVVPAPKRITLHDFVTNAENYEGQLVEIDTLYKATGTWPAVPANVSVYVTNASKADTTQIFIDLDSGIGGTEPQYPLNIVGFVSQYSSLVPPNKGYEICPRSMSDISTTPAMQLINVDGIKDAFFSTLTGPGDGYLQIRSYAYNDNGRPSNDNDLSAKVWTAWDPTWFYLYAEVKDDTVCGNAPQVYQEDGLELKFDPQPKDSVANSIFAVGITALRMGSPGVVRADSLGNVNDTLKQWARRIIPGGYALEIAMKWSAIGTTEKVSAAKDSVFGLAVCFHDNDSSRARVASIEWGVVMRDAVWNTPKYLGTVKFLADNKLAFIPKNNMTGLTNPIPYDGSDYVPTGVEESQTTVPLAFGLSHNYPNPFNPTTTLQFTVKATGYTTLSVYNILGQQVATLFDGNAIAGQLYVRSFDASKLTSGVYLARLESGGMMQVQKLILMK